MLKPMNTKEQVILELVKAGEQAISGETLAKMCGVSRAAIWKAVQALRSEGNNITGSPNGGYILHNREDSMTAELISYYVSERFPAYKDCLVECFKEVDSTNTYAKRLLASCEPLHDWKGNKTDTGRKYHQAIIVAESQSAGRGRAGRTFYSPQKTGVYMSLIYAPRGGITRPAFLTACTAVAVCRAIQKLYTCDASIKWVNDIFLNGKKIGGILTEGVSNFETGYIEAAVIGIGINISRNAAAFPDEVALTAGSIFPDGVQQKNISRGRLAAEIAGQVFESYGEDRKLIIEEYKARSCILGKMLTVHPLIGDDTPAYTARALDIDDEACLIVETEVGVRKKLVSAEVTLHASQFKSGR